jgi:hypothetical protein
MDEIIATIAVIFGVIFWIAVLGGVAQFLIAVFTDDGRARGARAESQDHRGSRAPRSASRRRSPGALPARSDQQRHP